MFKPLKNLFSNNLGGKRFLNPTNLMFKPLKKGKKEKLKKSLMTFNTEILWKFVEKVLGFIQK